MILLRALQEYEKSPKLHTPNLLGRGSALYTVLEKRNMAERGLSAKRGQEFEVPDLPKRRKLGFVSAEEDRRVSAAAKKKLKTQ